MKSYRSFTLAVLFLFITAGLSSSADGQNVTPLLDCIEYDAATDTVTAHLGYDSREPNAVSQVLVGNDNRFVPNPANRGQNVLYLPGLHQRAFSVTFPGNTINQWLLLGQALTISHNPSAYCRQQSNQTPAVTPILTGIQMNNSTGQAIATFGYFSPFGGAIPKGSNNYLSFGGNAPYPGDRGQPSQFQAGLVRNAFQVTFNPGTEPTIAWNLLGQTVVAVPPLAPTAASVVVGGRVLTPKGRAVRAARLTLLNAGTSETRQALSSSFGYYRFSDVQAGETFVLEVRHKRHKFSPQVVQAFEDLETLDVTAEN